MSAISKAVGWAGDHPVLTAVGVFAIGGIVLLMLNKGSGNSDSGLSGFYAAQAAQQASNNQVALAQVQTVGATAVAKILADQNVAISAGQQATLQQGQRQQFFLATGQQQLEGQAMPYLLQKLGSGGPGGATDASTAAAEQIWHDFIAGGTGYNPAH